MAVNLLVNVEQQSAQELYATVLERKSPNWCVRL